MKSKTINIILIIVWFLLWIPIIIIVINADREPFLTITIEKEQQPEKMNR